MPSRQKARGRKESGPFVAIPKQVLESSAYAVLTAHEVKLLIDLTVQYNGSNNGDLCVAWSMMKTKGWKSKGTLYRAIKGLLERGFLVLTRQGGKHKPSLYAITFRAIDECKGKLDVQPTVTALNSWKKNRFATPNKYQCAPNEYQLSDISTG
ncbi:hypothetical protein A3193_18555 [Candidatus Thiodiazotropha endoloripes]|uniref:hypothetical protein n=1 Tax=Candidatus Thiodiazotropha endoloripes TaxID=1818881 RepID=UPI00083DD26D|nr:hypothetical protein [Candidatus Thiodiazotropha endoloripes]ODB82751.1 hypothetical protein A3193_18555 [Candidatus Thiodiazotropha endoloripes]